MIVIIINFMETFRLTAAAISSYQGRVENSVLHCHSDYTNHCDESDFFGFKMIVIKEFIKVNKSLG